MKPTLVATRYSWSDLLCSRCQTRVLREHHVPPTVRTCNADRDEIACAACRDTIAAAAAHAPGVMQVSLPTPERRGSAVHESGHSVVAEQLGLRVEDLQLHTTERANDTGAAARTRLEQGTADPDDYAAVLLAGQEAHLHWLHQHQTRTPSERELLEAILGGERDQTALEQTLHSVGADPSAYWRQGLQRAQQLVHRHWTEIEAVAGELDRTGSLTGEALRRLLTTARHSDRDVPRTLTPAP